MSKHTPGPWTSSVAYYIDHDYGRIPLIVPVNGENPVCKITVDYTDDVTEANARLIAAAPDLLDACEQVLTHYSGSLDFQPAYVRMAREAIAKARGEA